MSDVYEKVTDLLESISTVKKIEQRTTSNLKEDSEHKVYERILYYNEEADERFSIEHPLD